MIILNVVYIIFAIAIIVLAAYIFYKQYRKVAPNEVLVISGRRRYEIKAPDGTMKEIGYRFRVGGGAFINPLTEVAETLKLEVITINIKINDAISGEGVPITAEATGQVRVNTNEYPLTLAIEQFLGSGSDGIKEVTESIFEGKIRAIIGMMTVEELYRNRLEFAEKVEKAVEEDFESLGLELVAFVLKDISDAQGYLDALSRPKIVAVKREAQIAQAEADRDAAIKSAQARKEAEVARLRAEAEIAGASWENEAKKANSQVEVNKHRARADMSYEIERFKLSQELKKEEHFVRMIEKKNAIELEELEIERRQKELESTVIKPAEAKKFQVQMEAEAESYKQLTEAKGKFEAQKIQSDAESEHIKKIGQAQATAMLEKAKAYDKYNQAAIFEMIMNILPEIAKAIAEPLAKVEKIVIVNTDDKLGTNKITGQLANVISQVPEVIESITGVDIKKILKDKLTKDKE